MSVKLYYKEEGSGEPLILLHGNGEDHEYFCHQISYFSNLYHVFALDTRGHGKSPRGETEFTISQFAEDLYVFMKEHSIVKANILGFSDGGNIALVFALRHPECVKKLILNGANLSPDGVKASVQIPIVIGYRIASLFASKSVEAKRNAEMLALMVNEPHISPQELKKLSVRTLVIAGTKDMIKKSHIRQMYENLPNAELVFIEGDHFIANKQWQKFNEAVERFLH